MLISMLRFYKYEEEKASEYKKNKYIQRYLSSKKLKTSFVDINELKKNHPELLKIVKEGCIRIDDYALLVDLPSDGTSRGYVTMNKMEIKRVKDCFEKISVALKKCN